MSDYELGQHAARLGALESRLSAVETAVSRMDAKVDEVLMTLAALRGGWRAVMWLGSAAGAVVGAGVTLVLGVAKLLVARWLGH